MERTRLALIDDHVLFREALGLLLGASAELEIVGQCGNSADAVELLRRSAVDLVLLDFHLGAEHREDAIAALRAAGYAGRILVVTDKMDAPETLAALQAGASGIFLKHGSPAALMKAIRLVMSGEVWMDRRIVQTLAERVPAADEQNFPQPLTPREAQVLRGVLEGGTNRRIADGLGISEGAVKATVQQLFRKAGVHTRSKLVRVALKGLEQSSGS
jgi:DNA-binding NarL/FixJ family response regulator